MRTAILLTALLLTAGLAVTPTASATHCDNLMDPPPQACHAVLQAAEGALTPLLEYVICFLDERPPLQWGQCL